MSPRERLRNSATHRLHIVGAPRGGTTLMLELTRNCFAVDAYGPEERSIFLPPPIGQIVCTKNPQDVLVMRRVLPLMPQLHAIVMLRDPRDIVSACTPKTTLAVRRTLDRLGMPVWRAVG